METNRLTIFSSHFYTSLENDYLSNKYRIFLSYLINKEENILFFFFKIRQNSKVYDFIHIPDVLYPFVKLVEP